MYCAGRICVLCISFLQRKSRSYVITDSPDHYIYITAFYRRRNNRPTAPNTTLDAFLLDKLDEFCVMWIVVLSKFVVHFCAILKRVKCLRPFSESTLNWINGYMLYLLIFSRVLGKLCLPKIIKGRAMPQIQTLYVGELNFRNNVEIWVD